MNFIMHTSEPFTTKEFFDLDVDEKLKVELIGGALVVSPSAKPWHCAVSLRLRDALASALSPAFDAYLNMDVIVDAANVPRPDVFVHRNAAYGPDKVAEADDVELAVEIMSPGTHVNDRRVKPSLYRDAGIPSWRVESCGRHLALFEIPLLGDEVTHLGQVTLKVAGIDVPIDLDAIARYAFGE